MLSVLATDWRTVDILNYRISISYFEHSHLFLYYKPNSYFAAGFITELPSLIDVYKHKR